MLSRLLDAHEAVMVATRELAPLATSPGDDGSNDLLVSDVLRTNELEFWFMAHDLVNTPLVDA